MFAKKSDADKEHAKRVEEQIKQYANVEDMRSHLSDVFFYWQQKFFKPRFRALTECNNYLEFYAKVFVERMEKTGLNRIVSMGSGDGTVEVQIAQVMRKMGATDFIIDLVELSPIQNDRAIKKASEAGMSEHIETIEADFNFWRADKPYAAFIDLVEELNELLIELGSPKPMRFFAIMTKKPVENPRLCRDRTPEKMMRDPDVTPVIMGEV